MFFTKKQIITYIDQVVEPLTPLIKSIQTTLSQTSELMRREREIHNFLIESQDISFNSLIKRVTELEKAVFKSKIKAETKAKKTTVRVRAKIKPTTERDIGV